MMGGKTTFEGYQEEHGIMKYFEGIPQRVRSEGEECWLLVYIRQGKNDLFYTNPIINKAVRS